MLDEGLRTACMAHLSILVASFGEDVLYGGGLDHGFPFRGQRVPYLNRQKGIYRAGVQTGPAALSIQTSANSPYDDEMGSRMGGVDSFLATSFEMSCWAVLAV